MSTTPSITCPRCGRTSYNRTDIAQGFCGACHAWTSPMSGPASCPQHGEQVGYRYNPDGPLLCTVPSKDGGLCHRVLFAPVPAECPRCRGLGEVVTASHHVGDGCFNDDFDICPRCEGTGYETRP